MLRSTETNQYADENSEEPTRKVWHGGIVRARAAETLKVQCWKASRNLIFLLFLALVEISETVSVKTTRSLVLISECLSGNPAHETCNRESYCSKKEIQKVGEGEEKEELGTSESGSMETFTLVRSAVGIVETYFCSVSYLPLHLCTKDGAMFVERIGVDTAPSYVRTPTHSSACTHAESEKE